MASNGSKRSRGMSADDVLFSVLLPIYFCAMDVFKAIDKMRRLSEEGQSFSFSFMSYSYDRKKSEGIVQVRHARLRKQSRKEHNRFSNYMLNYINLDTLENGSCWQPLLLTFNNEELELK